MTSLDTHTFVQLISFLTVFVSLLFVVFLLTVKTRNKIGNIFLSGYLIVRAINLSAYFYYEYIELPTELELLRMDIGSFLEFPLLYLFVLTVIYTNFCLKRRYILHLLPFLIVSLIQLPVFYLASFEQQNEFADNYLLHPIGIFSTILAHLQNLFYIVLIFVELKRYKIIVWQNYSITHRFNYQWLFQMNLFVSSIFLIALLKNSRKYIHIEFLSFDSFKLFVALSILVFTCWLVIKALHAPKLFRGIDSKIPIISEASSTVSSLENKEELLENLTKQMTENEFFTDPELTIKELAMKVAMEERMLSLLINRHLHLNFHTYINSFRIAKAKKILQNPAHKNDTVLEVLYSVGFNSKSSFNTYFKKETGFTPTQFRNKHLKK